jgi:hypothetical protein
MNSPLLSKFLGSMQVTYEMWHDGIGYDLDALDALSESEKQQVEELLLERKANDWRDIEALDRLGTPRALERLKERAFDSKDIIARIMAAERLRNRGILDHAAVEAILLKALDETTLVNGMTDVLALAKQHHSSAVKKKILSKALHGNEDIRVHAAALAHHLFGKTKSDFDWDHRPLYLKFNARKRSERRRAFEELCALCGVDAAEFE